MLSMTEDEDEVKRVVEFVDSKGSEGKRQYGEGGA
jgi:hypothetical protein